MDSEWTTDIVDYSIFDADKADFIYQSCSEYLKATIDLSNDRERKSFQFLTLLVTIVSALIAYLLLKCDFKAFSCESQNGNFFWPIFILLAGFAVNALVVIIGCLKPRIFHFAGNEPRNLLKNELCKMPTNLIKISSAIAMQRRITANVRQLSRSGSWLNRAIFGVITTMLLTTVVAIFCV